MKNLITILLLTLNLVSFGQDTTDTFSERETIMINEINALRANPASYIPSVENYITMCNNRLEMLSKGTLISTADVKGQILAAEELIEVLSTTPPLNKLVGNIDMYLVTRTHGQYLKSINGSSHESSNGDLAPERMSNAYVEDVTENIVNDNGMITPTIMLLLVDAGIQSRGHRNNLLDTNARFISVYTNGTTWVQNFAN